MSKRSSIICAILSALPLVGILALPAGAVPGDLLGTVTLPGNPSGGGGIGCSVAGTFTGTYYLTTGDVQDTQAGNCAGDGVQVYAPPASGNGTATLVATKSIVDAANNPLLISGLAWDPSRNKVWGAHGTGVWLIDVGDLTTSTTAVATFAFTADDEGIEVIDGLEWDGSDDTLYHSPDISCNVRHYSTAGVLLNTVMPKNAAGQVDCSVSGVEVGTANTLYIGRNGQSEIRRVDKTTGAFVSQFATTFDRVEDLTCDPVTYAPNEAILAKDAYGGFYEAFEVEAGTCPADNLAPSAVDDAVSTRVGVNVTINVLANDSDPDADPLTVTGVSDPPNGTATINPDNSVTYDPDGCFTGTDTFTYTISDGRGGTDTANVAVRVLRPSRRTSIGC